MFPGIAYRVPIVAVSMNDAGVLALITAPSDATLYVSHIVLGQRSIIVSERQVLRLMRATSAGTGGRSVTPAPIMVGGPASGFTALDDGTAWTAQPTLTTALGGEGFDLLAGYEFVASNIDEAIVISPSGRLALDFVVTPSAAVVWDGHVIVHEAGG